MTDVRVTERDGSQRIVSARDGVPLMEALRDAGFMLGTCGGACACGTCHVYVGAAFKARLPAMIDDEQMMLEAIAELVEVRTDSRLSCQIPVSDALTGIEVEIGPVA